MNWKIPAFVAIAVITVVTITLIAVMNRWDILTAIATTILAGTAIFTYLYARRQLDLMRRNNEADHIKEIFNLEEKMIKVEMIVRDLRLKIISYDYNKEVKGKISKTVDKYLINLIIYYNRLENLCFYILHFQKSVQNNDLLKEIKEKYRSYFKRIWETEKEFFKGEEFARQHPFIPKLFRDWEILRS